MHTWNTHTQCTHVHKYIYIHTQYMHTCAQVHTYSHTIHAHMMHTHVHTHKHTWTDIHITDSHAQFILNRECFACDYSFTLMNKGWLPLKCVQQSFHLPYPYSSCVTICYFILHKSMKWLKLGRSIKNDLSHLYK